MQIENKTFEYENKYAFIYVIALVCNEVVINLR